MIFNLKKECMSRNLGYNTRQRETILAAIKNQKKGFTVKELAQDLSIKIGLTTIYRFVEKLADEGVLYRTLLKDNTTEYQYLEPCQNTDHFYLKCDKCGELEHVDCKKIQGLTKHIINEHHFRPMNAQIVINGICAKCAK